MEHLQTPEHAAHWLRQQVRGSLWADSRKVSAGDGFVAWPGAATDARQYVPEVLAAGARACLVEQAGAETFGFSDARVATYSGLKAATAPIAAAYFEHPSRLENWHYSSQFHRLDINKAFLARSIKW